VVRLRPYGDGYTFGAGRYAMRQMHVPTALALVTCKTMLASPGGWSKGASTSKKSGPNCSTGIEPPSTRSRIFTWAECPP